MVKIVTFGSDCNFLASDTFLTLKKKKASPQDSFPPKKASTQQSQWREATTAHLRCAHSFQNRAYLSIRLGTRRGSGGGAQQLAALGQEVNQSIDRSKACSAWLVGKPPPPNESKPARARCGTHLLTMSSPPAPHGMLGAEPRRAPRSPSWVRDFATIGVRNFVLGPARLYSRAFLKCLLKEFCKYIIIFLMSPPVN